MLSTRMKILRKEKQWNQAELGQRIGVGRTTITEYERGTIVPPYEKIHAMAEAFGVSVKYLTGESNSKNEEINDVDDLMEELNQLLDKLSNKDVSVKMNGHLMQTETKNIAAEQLKQAIRILNYMDKMNK